jgi:hypothetical protein
MENYVKRDFPLMVMQTTYGLPVAKVRVQTMEEKKMSNRIEQSMWFKEEGSIKFEEIPKPV